MNCSGSRAVAAVVSVMMMAVIGSLYTALSNTRNFFVKFQQQSLIFSIQNSARFSTDFLTDDQEQIEPVIDVLSIGSINRLDLLEAQQRGYQPYVRNYFNVTERDDADPTCHSNLTIDQVFAVSNFCRSRKRRNAKESNSIQSMFRNRYARIPFLQAKKNPIGWLCAQPRFALGLYTVIKSYETSSLPDYLVMGDDDTYVDVGLFQEYVKSQNISAEEPVVSTGCLVRWPVHQVNFTFAWGGFGTIFSTGAIRNLMKPIHCTSAAAEVQGSVAVCNRIQENLVGERSSFQEGMSLIEFMYAFSISQPYREISSWTTGNCLHSDWVISFFVNFYNVSRHNDAPKFFENVSQERTIAIQGSETYRNGLGLCRNNCVPGKTMICHEQNVTRFDSLFNHQRERMDI